MKKLIALLTFLSISGCMEYEWEVSPRRVFRPAPVYCYQVWHQQPRCFRTAEQCVADEQTHDDISITPCRAVYMTR